MWPNPQENDLLKKSLEENFIFCAVSAAYYLLLAHIKVFQKWEKKQKRSGISLHISFTA